MKKRQRWCAVLLSLMLLAGCLPVSAIGGSGEKSGYSLTPVSGSVSAVMPDGAWILQTAEPKTAAEVEEALIIEGQPPLLVEEKSETEFYITPSEPLSGNTLYRFCWQGEGETFTRVFQTQKQFRIQSVFPAHTATGVPIDSGIEITYNEDVFAEDDHPSMENFFTVSPAVEGTFAYHRNTAVFVPKALAYGTVYTVSVAAGLTSPVSGRQVEEETVFSFETEAEPGSETEEERETSIWLSSIYGVFSTLRAPELDLNIYCEDQEFVDAKVGVYRYRSAEEAIQSIRDIQKVPMWAMTGIEKYKADLSNMERVTEFAAEKLPVYGDAKITLPDRLTEGFYLLHIQCGEETKQMVLQISDLPIQVIGDAEKTLVWVNSAKTGVPVSGAAVTDRVSGRSYQTDENGLAVLAVPAYDLTEIAVASEEGQCIWIGDTDRYAARYAAEKDGERRDHYRTVLQTDRSLYQKSDTVSLWGFVKPRDENKKEPSSVTAVLSCGYWQDAHSVLQKQTYMVENGVYAGKLTLPALSAGSYCITVYKGNYDENHPVTLGQIYFDVADYHKPAYELRAAVDKTAVFAGETVHATIEAAFYEGTPLPELRVAYRALGDRWDAEGYHRDELASGVVQTDANGMAAISITVPPAWEEYHGVESGVDLHITAAVPELGEISDDCSIRVFQRDTVMEAEGETDGQNASVQVSLNRVTLDRILDGSAEGYRDYLGAAVPKQKIKAEVYRVYDEKVPDGTYYDFIEKKNKTQYIYQQREERVKSFTMITDENGAAKEHWSLPSRKEGSYFVRLTASDATGNPIKEEVYLGTSRRSYAEKTEGYHLDGAAESYHDGDAIALTLCKGKNAVKDRKTLFVKAQNGILDYSMTQNEYHSTFRKEDAPNLYVMAYYFDGTGYQSGYRLFENLRYAVEDEALQLSVQTDREQYLPGDLCYLKITAKDRDGNPKQAELNLSVVDEALLSMQDVSVDTLQQLYRNVGSGIVVSDATHEEEENAFGMSSGGAGASKAMAAESVNDMAAEEDTAAVRSDFKDTALFDHIQTKEDGTAAYAFTLPDNITSWRLTVSGISEDYKAGNLVYPIAVSQPMFLSYALGSVFLKGDIPSLSVGAYGNELEKEEAVTFTVYRKSNPEEKHTAKAKAYQRIAIPLWEMNFVGEDTLVIAAQTEWGKADSLEHPYRVTDGYRQRQTVKTERAEAGMRLETDDTGLGRIVFTDRSRGQYLYRLLNLCNPDGDRVEKQVAAAAAKELLAQYFPEFADEETDEFDLSAYQREDGGAAILPYAQSDLDLTVRLMPYRNHAWDDTRLYSYLYEKYEGDDAESKVCALYGLAQLGEPVLDELERYAEADDLEISDAVYLALSYLTLGETETASAVYDHYLLPRMEKQEPYAMLSGSSRDEVQKLTAQAAYLAAALQKPEQDGLYRYSTENEPEDILITIEEVSYLKEALKDSTPDAGSVTYRLFDDTKTVDLKEYGSFVLTLPCSQMDALDILAVNGDVEVLTAKNRPIDAETQMDPHISVKRRYYRVGSESSTKELQEGDLVRVNLWIDYSDLAMDGTYCVTDYLPAGLAYVENSAGMDEKETGSFGIGCLRYADSDGQKVRFYDHNSRFDTGRLYYYYARVVSPGTYCAEGTLVQNLRSRESLTWGENDILNIH